MKHYQHYDMQSKKTSYSHHSLNCILFSIFLCSRAKNISNKPVINEDPKDAMLREYQAEISKLKTQLASSGMMNGTISTADSEIKQRIEDEKTKLTQFYEEEAIRLKAEHESQRKEKEDLMRGIDTHNSIDTEM